jgi:probable HAF family extracellular repeat protein
MNDCGQPHGGLEYAADYYANLSVHDSFGNLHFELRLGLGDHLYQHNFSVELLSYSYEEMSFLMDGNVVVMERIENDTTWDTWHGYYIASHESGVPNRSSIGVISPEYFPGLPSHYYVELRFSGLSSFTCTQLDVVDDPVNVSYGYGMNNYGKCVGSSGVEYGLHNAVIWEHQHQGYVFDGLWGLWSCAHNVNDMGSVVGSSHTTAGTVHALLWRYDDVKIDIGALGGTDCVSYGYDVNNLGDVVGSSYLEPNQWDPPHAFLWNDVNGDGVSDPGEMIDLGTLPGDDASVAKAINDQVQVVGTSSYTDSATHSHAFLWSDEGGMMGLDVLPGDTNSHAYDVNNHGQVVGYSFGSEPENHAFLWEDGMVQQLPSLGGLKTVAHALNDHGEIVGSSTSSDRGSQHACIWIHGEVWDLNDLIPNNSGWELIEAFDINNPGQIVGYGVSPAGDVRGFMLTLDDGFVLEPKYTFITSYREGGGIFLFSLLCGDTFSSDVSVSVDAPAEMHASVFSEVINASCPIAEVIVQPDDTTVDGDYVVTVEATSGQQSHSVQVVVNISIWGTSEPWYAIIKFNEFLPWLEQNHPEVGDLSVEDWWIYQTYTHILIVEHWTFLSDNWEVRLQIHATVPPHNWTKLWIRPRDALMGLFAVKREYNGTTYEISIEDFGTKYGY